jgi:putative transcriptional regulator
MKDMVNITQLTNYFLVATPNLKGSFFEGAVTYICDHTHQGAMGLIINHPVPLKMDIIIQEEKASLQKPSHFNKLIFRSGGPLQHDTHFVIHRDGKKWNKTFRLTENNNLSLTSSTDVLKYLVENENEACSDAFMTLGFSGWEAGQLEKEIASDDWLICPADPRVIFETPLKDRWRTALSLQGIDPAQFFHQAGHC